MAKIGFIGLGVMGAGMAGRLLDAGHELSVWNRTRSRADGLVARGARVADSPADCAREADFVLSMVADDQASREVWLGAEGVMTALAPGATCIECSTLTPAWIEEFGHAAASKGYKAIDAPVTGSIPQANEGQLLLLVGGNAEDVEQARPVLSAISRGIVHLGPLGSGARMKLINNFLCGVQAASLAEALGLAERCSLDVKQVHQLLSDGAPGSPLVKGVGARMVQRSEDFFFQLSLMAKDLRYSAALGSVCGMQLPMAEAALTEFNRAIDAGLGNRDFSAVAEPLRRS